MDKTTLILIMLGLLILLVVLVAIYVLMHHKSENADDNACVIVTFESLVALIGKQSTTNQELNSAVDVLLERFVQVSEGKRDFTQYATLLEKLCTHPNTDSKMILRFQKALIAANQKYKGQIEQTLKMGLAGRK
jgi:uncharacterized membrane protein